MPRVESSNALGNLSNVIQALRLKGVVSVEYNYSGSGDSGWFEQPTFLPENIEESFGEATCLLTSGKSRFEDGKWVEYGVTEETKLRDACTFLAEWYVEAKHGGWENNEGGQGSVVFNVVEGTMTVEHEDNIIEVQSYTHTLGEKTSAPDGKE
jgi:hypothetical protein